MSIYIYTHTYIPQYAYVHIHNIYTRHIYTHVYVYVYLYMYVLLCVSLYAFYILLHLAIVYLVFSIPLIAYVPPAASVPAAFPAGTVTHPHRLRLCSGEAHRGHSA